MCVCICGGGVFVLANTSSIQRESEKNLIFFQRDFSKVNDLQAFTQNIINTERETEFIVPKCYTGVYRNSDL